MPENLRYQLRLLDADDDPDPAAALRTDLSINYRGNSLSLMSASGRGCVKTLFDNFRWRAEVPRFLFFTKILNPGHSRERFFSILVQALYLFRVFTQSRPKADIHIDQFMTALAGRRKSKIRSLHPRQGVAMAIYLFFFTT